VSEQDRAALVALVDALPRYRPSTHPWLVTTLVMAPEPAGSWVSRDDVIAALAALPSGGAEDEPPTLSVWTPHPSHEMIRGAVCVRCCASLGTHTVTRPCSQPTPQPSAARCLLCHQPKDRPESGICSACAVKHNTATAPSAPLSNCPTCGASRHDWKREPSAPAAVLPEPVDLLEQARQFAAESNICGTADLVEALVGFVRKVQGVKP